MKPLISLFATGIRTHMWEDLYRSLSKSSVSFELIMVGPNVPDFPLPKNFHYIYSNTKPAQCSEIAARYTTADLIMNVGDDLRFSDNALDEMFNLYEKNASEELVISCRMSRDNILYDIKHHLFLGTVPGSPLMPLCQLMSKTFWNRLGGIDKRFTAVFWTEDVAMRAYEAGGKFLIAEKAIMEEVFDKPSIVSRIINKITNTRKAGLYVEYGISIDRPLLDSFWVSSEQESQEDIYDVNDQGVSVLKQRKSPVILFEDNHLLTVSQEPTGRW